MKRTTYGFTLLELLVALAIFAVLAALAYTALNQVLKVRNHTSEQVERISALQRSIVIVQRDIEQMVIREVRDEFGDTEPALVGGMIGEDILRFTRTGWSNPLGLPRSHLQRIAYGINDGQLIRKTWGVLDRAPGDEPYQEVLLKGVRTMEIRFLDANLQWQEYWPPNTVVGNEITPWPRALEVTIDTTDFGRITRLFPLPS